MKQEQQFLELINVTVSHELRNPLTSLIGQISSMEKFFKMFNQVIQKMEDDDDTKNNLIEIYTGLQKCGKKMTAACDFIDFFVHDILDYSILNNNSKFIADNEIFDIREAIN